MEYPNALPLACFSFPSTASCDVGRESATDLAAKSCHDTRLQSPIGLALGSPDY